MTNNQLTDPQAPVSDEELDQMIWKLERDGGMTPKMLSLMRELRGVRRASAEKLNQPGSETERTHPNSFTDAELEMMAHGDNPQANAYRELLAFRRNSPVSPGGWKSEAERLADKHGSSKFTVGELKVIAETDLVQRGDASALARMALDAMDSEPVAWLLSGGGAKNAVSFDSGNAYADPLREVTPLYRHAQPAPETHWIPLPAAPQEVVIAD